MTISISGTVYTDEGTTPMGLGRTVNVSVNGGAADAVTALTLADGTYTLAGITAASGAVLTIYLQDNTELGVRVTVSNNADLAGADIYQDYLIVAKGNAANPTAANINTSDNNGATGITGIYSCVSTAQLSVFKGLHIPVGSTFASTMTSIICFGNVHNYGAWITGSHTTSLSGTSSYTLRTGGSAFGAVTVGGVGGTYTLTDNLSMTIGTANLILNNGTLDVSASNFNITLVASWNNVGGTFNARAGTVTFDSASNRTVNARSSNFYNLTKLNTGTLTLSTNALVVTNNLTISAGTLDVSASNLGLTVGGNWSNSTTFNGRSGTVTLNGTAQVVSGTTTFYNLVANTSGDVLSFTDGTTTTVSNSVTFQNVTLQGTGTGGWTIAMPATQTIDHVTVSYSTTTGNTAVAGATSTNGGNNTNWTFGASNVVTTASDGKSF